MTKIMTITPKEETELEYYQRILKMLPLYPNPLSSHAMAYVSTKIDRLKETGKRKLDSKEANE